MPRCELMSDFGKRASQFFDSLECRQWAATGPLSLSTAAFDNNLTLVAIAKELARIIKFGHSISETCEWALRHLQNPVFQYGGFLGQLHA
ncbi:hypothetical protein ROA7745_03965 [Roseovarius aestuarii]|uniref:Uncharacterized protein n=1 Tax=Roseovarius aestuarii TaxID=475083 RepID=A0A1X7BWT2_9RHOB|nr:hypothetical protein ROA7745_03965 [Roseovarius aestuarii]